MRSSYRWGFSQTLRRQANWCTSTYDILPGAVGPRKHVREKRRKPTICGLRADRILALNRITRSVSRSPRTRFDNACERPYTRLRIRRQDLKRGRAYECFQQGSADRLAERARWRLQGAAPTVRRSRSWALVRRERFSCALQPVWCPYLFLEMRPRADLATLRSLDQRTIGRGLLGVPRGRLLLLQ